MITEEDFDAASDASPEMAFVRLERKFRAAYERNVEGSDSNGAYNHYTSEYMNHTVAAAKALGLDILSEFEIPSPDGGDVYETYKIFRQEVDHFSVQIQIAHIRSGPKNSVALDSSEKKHLRAYADKIKDIIDKSTIQTAKKERLFDKINAFITELDRDRTPLQKFTDIVMTLSVTGADAAEELEPTWKWVKLAAAILGVRQETEQTKLPAPPKKLEGPKRQLAPPKKGDSSRRNMDDEIPF
jgi:hypothetical protein